MAAEHTATATWNGDLMGGNGTQRNSPLGTPASEPVNGGPGPDSAITGGNVYFHSPTYGAAVDNNGNADCETGQRGYPRQLNFFDPKQRQFDTDQHTRDKLGGEPETARETRMIGCRSG